MLLELQFSSVLPYSYHSSQSSRLLRGALDCAECKVSYTNAVLEGSAMGGGRVEKLIVGRSGGGESLHITGGWYLPTLANVLLHPIARMHMKLNQLGPKVNHTPEG